jgi:hypothetical protein
MGSESLLNLVDSLDVPGTCWLVDLPGDGSNTNPPGAGADPYSGWPQVLIEAAAITGLATGLRPDLRVCGLPRSLSLGTVFGVSSSSQLTGGRGDLDLKIGCWRQADHVAVDFHALRSCCGAGRSVLNHREPVGCGPRGGARQQFSKVVGLRHPSSEVVRAPRACGPGEHAAVPFRPVKRVGSEAQQDRLDDRGVVENRR